MAKTLRVGDQDKMKILRSHEEVRIRLEDENRDHGKTKTLKSWDRLKNQIMRY